MQVTAGDGSMSSTETVNITVTHTNFAPDVRAAVAAIWPRRDARSSSRSWPATWTATPLLYNLLNPPAGATFNASNGLFTWTPGVRPGRRLHPSLHGRRPDGRDRDASSVVLHVAHVVRPPVLDTPNHQATLGMPLAFPIQATDLDAGTTLTLLRRSTCPTGATINAQTGQFQWTPGPSQAGDYVVTLQVSDGQATSTQNILIQAAVQPQLPSVTIVLTPSFPAIPGQQVVINAIASSVAPIASLVVTFNGQPLDAQCERPGHDHRRRARPDADHGDGDRPGRLDRHGDGLPQGARPERHDAAGRLLRQLGPLRRAVEPHGDPRHGRRQQPRLVDAGRSPRPNNPAFTVLATGQHARSTTARWPSSIPASMANGFYQLRLTATDMSGRTATDDRPQIEIHTPTKPNDVRGDRRRPERQPRRHDRS